MERRLVAILAADVVGYSRLMGASEAGTLSALKAHRRELVDGKIAEHQGRIVKLTGDGMLVEFPSVVNAVACAVEIQRRMQERNTDVPQERRIEFRIGVNLGDIIFEDNDIFGDGVNVAARIESVAKPGGVSVSGPVRDSVGNRLELVFEDMGEQALKNIERPVRIYNVSLGAIQPRAPAAPPPQVAPAMKDKPSIAVLPFVNMSGDPEQEYFSDGITEDIITDLSKISGLRVIARNTVFAYKGKPSKVQRIAEELKVKFVLEGSVRKAGQRVRITGQLIDGKDGDHVWAERYDRDLTDIFAIQDDITHTIVEQLKVKLLPEEQKAIAQASTNSVEAYTYYLRGRELFHSRSKPSLTRARSLFARSVELDPLYARAYAGVADCDSILSAYYGVNVSLESVLETCDKALRLDPVLAEAHASRGLALAAGGRDEEAVGEFEQAIALDPDSYEGHYFYARHLFQHGDFAKAVEHYGRATEIQPDDYKSPLLAMNALHSLGRYDEEAKLAKIGLERAERALKLHPEYSQPAIQGACALAALGQKERAKEWAARALAIDSDDPQVLYNAACVYSLVGEIDQAFDILDKILPDFSNVSLKWLANDSDLDAIRIHPRYEGLLKRFGGDPSTA
jgi:adenylate cyclase